MSEYRPLGSDEEASKSQNDQVPLLPVDEEELAQGTILGSIANLSNTILGTGMLSMPHAVAAGGIVPGAFTILFSASVAFFGLYLLSRSAARVGRKASFAALSSITLPSLQVVFDSAIALKCFGVSISYLIIIGSLMPKVVLSFASHPDNVPQILLDRRLWLTISMTILTPICFFKSLNALRYTSYVALLAVGDLVFVVIYKYFDRSGLELPRHVDIFHVSPALLSSLPVYIFAFTCAQNLLPVHNELKENTQQRMNLVIGTSIGSAAGIYEVIGLLGYLTFGTDVASNIMESYHNSVAISICRLGIVIMVLFSYPLQLHPCRASLEKVFTRRNPLEEDHDDHGVLAADVSLLKYVGMTAGILLATFLISIQVSQLEVVLGFVGATGSTTISFILPALFFIKLFANSENKQDQILRKFAYALFGFGFCVMFVCLGLNIYELSQPTHRVGRGKQHDHSVL